MVNQQSWLPHGTEKWLVGSSSSLVSKNLPKSFSVILFECNGDNVFLFKIPAATVYNFSVRLEPGARTVYVVTQPQSAATQKKTSWNWPEPKLTRNRHKILEWLILSRISWIVTNLTSDVCYGVEKTCTAMHLLIMHAGDKTGGVRFSQLACWLPNASSHSCKCIHCK